MLGVSPSDIQNELIMIHADASPSLRSVFRWVELIKSDTIEFQKQPGPRRPIFATTYQ